jgi:hypothetical protein
MVVASEPVTTRVWQEAVVSVNDLDQSARFFLAIGGYEVRWRGQLRESELAVFDLSGSARGEAMLLGPAGSDSGLIRLVRFDNAGRREPMR